MSKRFANIKTDNRIVQFGVEGGSSQVAKFVMIFRISAHMKLIYIVFKLAHINLNATKCIINVGLGKITIVIDY